MSDALFFLFFFSFFRKEGLTYVVLLPGKRQADGIVHEVEFPWVWFGFMAGSQGFYYHGGIRLWRNDFMKIWRAVDEVASVAVKEANSPRR